MRDTLLLIGVLELAAAALLGWAIALQRTQPETVARLGVRAPHRLMQLHLDFVMMGVILIAVATAFPDLPDWTALALAVGTITNPLLFLPLAFAPKLDQRLGFRIVTVASFAVATVGFVGLAAWFAAGR